MARKIARILVWLRRRGRRALPIAPLRLWAFAVAIGAAGAYGVIGFRMAIDAVSLLAFGETEAMVVSGAAALDPLRAWAAPVVGGFVVAGLLFLAARFKWLQEGRCQGVAEVIEARAVGGGRISLRAGLASAAISAISLGAGASAGREGPAVHLGATIASLLDRWFGFAAKERRTLLGCGAAAAVAASFNAPVAGVLFALEVILGNYALSVFGPIAAASVTAAIVTRIHLGDFPAFAPPDYGPVAALDIGLSALLGVLCGVIAAAFLLSVERTSAAARMLADRWRLPYYMLPPLAGVIIGAIGAFFPEVFGVGYEAVTRALEGGYPIHLLAILAALKLVATAVTLSCRFGGGVFSPGLVIGVFAGAAYGGLLDHYVPGVAASPVYYAMIGMGAVCGAIMGAPISTTLIAFELTGDYGITIALMVAVALATLITQQLAGNTFFHWQLARRGYDLSEGPQGVILETIRVRDVMEPMPPSAPLNRDAARLYAEESLGEALARLEKSEEAGLPVVDEADEARVVGYLTRVRALAAYNRALVESHVEHHR
ncbi:chloride channel protein [Amphiplicatus metriothermophilus]|uniref:Chloride channel protein, CIC family n=1 Tax=Amphiplicatus metriothermophilus TaxID=1519374 RepID=A0A239PQB9_9PROT|nr:chloride channel protein [Amphiplicatus metriothermophilus]MBB5518347.1 CIC family chloride channel protein [Amphiplicatus metriothermophilus]SNT72484.1 chloride channel protein, CIC family [Amphiplicatus metriothermophilus]